MNDTNASTFIIVGVTSDGRTFRPSDWPERLCGIMSAFGSDHRMKYSPYVHPVTHQGKKSVFVDGKLKKMEPMAFNFLRNFAQDNDLKILDPVLDDSHEGAVCEIPSRS